MNARNSVPAVALLAVLVIAIAAFLHLDPLARLTGEQAETPPDLMIERVTVDADGFHLSVRGEGREPASIAQVLVNEAYWQFEQTPPGPIARGERVRVDIPFMWTQGEPHDLTLVTGEGSTFDHVIDVTTATPVLTVERLAGYALVGLFVGVVPVALGMALLPAMRRFGTRGLTFVLALTLGLLAFLLVDTFGAALEAAERAAGVFEAEVLVWMVAIASFALILVAGRSHGTPRGHALALCLAFGIGVHNLGEGLAIGGAVAAGELALGTFLVLGFTLHNVTEGIGIVAPLVRERTRLLGLLGLLLLAGLPAVFGIWIGVRAAAPHWTALFLAVGAGAIAQVLFEIGALLRRTTAGSAAPWNPLAGFLTGVGVMYATALLV